jgi:hypothetical protein
MNIREISDVFKDTAADITALKSYNFGWASDRVRQGNTEDFQELNEFPRVFFAVPTITGSDQTRKQDTYQVTLFFDDLLGYDNKGDEDPTLQIDKWANLQQYANYFVQRLNKIKQSILPNYLFIPEAPSITFDSFTGLQRMITVQLSFNLVVPTNCDPSIITLVQCIANIVTSSNLTASLTTVLKFAASLEGRATVTADINFVQKAQASLLTSANVTGNLTIPKTFNASLLATGTTTADLTVNAAASLLLDLYPDAAAAYSLRKLKTAYTGSAVRVRRSSDNTEQDIGFVADELDTASLLAFCGVGNGFVQTWYDQSGNANNAIQTTAASQPIIVLSGAIQIQNNSNCINFTASNLNFLNLTYYLSGSAGSRFAILKLKQRPVSQVSSGLPIDEIGSSNVGSYYTNTSGPLADDFASTTRKDPAGDISTNILTSIHIYTTISIPNKFTNWANNNQIFDTNTNTVGYKSTGGTPRIGSGLGFVTNFIDGYLFEIIVYTSDQSLNRTGIESNINTNYAIY